MIDIEANMMNLAILLYQVVIFSAGFGLGFAIGKHYSGDS